MHLNRSLPVHYCEVEEKKYSELKLTSNCMQLFRLVIR